MQYLFEVVSHICLSLQNATATYVDFLDAPEMAYLELITLQQEPEVQLAAFYEAVCYSTGFN